MVDVDLLDVSLNDIVSYEEFFEAFGYKPDDDLYCRLIHDKDRKQLAYKLHYKINEFNDAVNYLHKENAKNRGVFFVVNGGGDEDTDVKLARAQYVDFDDFPFVEQIDKISDFPLEPSIIIKTYKSLHCYWLLDEGVCISSKGEEEIDPFRNIQRRLIQYFGSDGEIQNPSRVMRLYGFEHRKNEPVTVNLIKFDPDLRYTQDELREVLPTLKQKKAEADKPKNKKSNSNLDIEDALNSIDVSNLEYGEWLRIGMALKNEGYSVDIWDKWSEKDNRYEGTDEIIKKWNSFKKEGATAGTIVYLAQKAGWQPKEVEGSAVNDFNDDYVDDDVQQTEKQEEKKLTPEEEKAEYIKINAEYALDNFLKELEDQDTTPYIPTGFERLDKYLDGGLYPLLHVVGAISSLGKTTLVLQICDMIANYTFNDVLIFSLEMGADELIAKSISRHTAELDLLENNTTDHAKTQRGISVKKFYKNYSDIEKELISKAVDEYRSYSGNIYIKEGLGDIGYKEVAKGIKKHIELTGCKPVVVIDYLQIMKQYNTRATDKQNTDETVSALKRICRDFKLPIICVSSFNRENYNTKATMSAFKESGNIEYSADVLIALQLKGVGDSNFDVDKAKAQVKREVELLVLKQRAGRVGEKINYSYFAKFNLFVEAKAGGQYELPETLKKSYSDTKRQKERERVTDAFLMTCDKNDLSTLTAMAEYMDITRKSTVKTMINEYGDYKVDSKGVVSKADDLKEALRKSETPLTDDDDF